MAENPEKFLTQAAFARRRGVSKKTVTLWKGNGLLKLAEDGRVDVEESEWNLDQRPAKYRGGTTHRPVREDPRVAPAEPRRAPKAERPAPAPGEDPEDVGEFDPDSPNLPLPAAVQRKENWLGLQRKQAVEKEEGRLVDRATAEKLFFDTARDLRDAWLGWPARIAVVMADELNVDARALTAILTSHVKQHLAELGEQEPQFD